MDRYSRPDTYSVSHIVVVYLALYNDFRHSFEDIIHCSSAIETSVAEDAMVAGIWLSYHEV